MAVFSAPMGQIMDRLQAFDEFEIIHFGDKVILEDPVESLDQYKLAGNNQALKMETWMADYFYVCVRNVLQKYSFERHWQSLNEETGGMNDVLYQSYTASLRIQVFAARTSL